MAIDLAWQVGPELCIYQAAQQHAAWLEELSAVESDPPCRVALDVSAVEAIDSAGVQLLISLRVQLAQSGGELQLVSPSAAVLDALQVFGLDLHVKPEAVAS
jgi:anti-anti-sigma factor